MLNNIYNAIDPVAFSIGPFSVRWYGIAYILGFVCAALIVYACARHWKICYGGYYVLTLTIFCAVGVIVGARLGYCLIYGQGYYFTHPLQIFAISNGGMSFHGAMVGMLLAVFIYAVIYHMPFMTLSDLLVIGIPIGLFFGRCANFINGELYGAPTDLPWGVDFTGTGIFYHPSQLYEGLLEGLVIFLVLFILSRRLPPFPRGTFSGFFLILYGCFRIVLEFVRLPDAQMGYFFGTWGTMGQLLSLPMVIIGILLLIYAAHTHHPQAGIGKVPAETAEDD